ncbi:MAG TPA: HEAT repeat domain-containing protein [Deltaproteobacteria bacterium]|nr:HEAT repeat domain-containing protein [Deltaproteobacteria bacterium]
MDLDTIYDRLAAGGAPDEDLLLLVPGLARRALRRSLEPDPGARLAALAVARALGPAPGQAVVRALINDPEEAVRARALELALEAGPDGIGALRSAATGSDPRLLAEALLRLGRILDPSAAPAARRALAHPEAPVRSAAAYLLGRIAGPSTQTTLEALATNDPDPGVQRAAHDALERIAGRRARGGAEPWWGSGALDRGPGSPASPPAPQPPPPPDPRALARLVATTSGRRRAEALSKLSAGEVTELLGSRSAETDLHLGRGLILAAVALRLSTAAIRLRQLTSAPEPGVRAAAAAALGSLAGPSILPALTRLLDDPAEQVRASTIEAITEVSIRAGRADFAQGVLDQLASGQPARVAEAILAARRELER